MTWSTPQFFSWHCYRSSSISRCMDHKKEIYLQPEAQKQSRKDDWVFIAQDEDLLCAMQLLGFRQMIFSKTPKCQKNAHWAGGCVHTVYPLSREAQILCKRALHLGATEYAQSCNRIWYSLNYWMLGSDFLYKGTVFESQVFTQSLPKSVQKPRISTVEIITALNAAREQFATLFDMGLSCHVLCLCQQLRHRTKSSRISSLNIYRDSSPSPPHQSVRTAWWWWCVYAQAT